MHCLGLLMDGAAERTGVRMLHAAMGVRCVCDVWLAWHIGKHWSALTESLESESQC